MAGDVTCGGRPFPDTVLPVAVDAAGGDVVLGVGQEDVPVGGVDGDAVGGGDLLFRAVGDEVAGDGDALPGVEDGVAGAVVQGDIEEWEMT